MKSNVKCWLRRTVVSLTGIYPQVFASYYYPAILGHGYDKIKLESRQSQCMSGSMSSTSVKEVTTTFQKVESQESLNQQFDFQIPGALFVQQQTGLGRFVVKARDSHLSSTYLLSSKVTTVKEVMGGSEVSFSDPDKFYETCGDHYVSMLDKGGLLNVGIKFSFSSLSDKQLFDSQGAVSSMAGLKTHIRDLSSSVKRRASVEVFFHQIGGDLAELQDLLEGEDVAACSLENYEPCQRLVERLWDYNAEHFVKTVLDGYTQTIGFKTTPYLGVEKKFVEPQVAHERKVLLDQIEGYYFDQEELKALQLQGRKMVDCDRRCQSVLATRISANIRDINDSIILSFSSPKRFLKYGMLKKLKLHKYTFPQVRARRSQLWRVAKYAVLAGAAVLPYLTS